VLGGGDGGAAHGVEDVGEQRGARCLMPRRGLEQLLRACHRERQDELIRLGDGKCVPGGMVRRVLVTELTMGEGGKQLSLHDRDVADGRCHAVQDRLHRAGGFCQFAFREADPRSIPSRAVRVRRITGIW
jgi:hypothetical protein